MQLNPVLHVPDPPPLPAGPAWERYLLESPTLPVGLVLLAGAIATAVLWSREQRRRAAIAGAIALVMGGVLFAVAMLVKTPREQVREAVVRVVDAAAKGDTGALEGMLTQDCTLYYFESPTGLSKNAIVARVGLVFGPSGAYALSEHKVQELQAHVPERQGSGAPQAQAQVKVWVRSKQWQVPHTSWWRLDLENEGGVWRVRAIMPTAIQGIADPSGR